MRQYDGMGRPTISTQYEGASSIQTATVYNALGRTATVSNPTRGGGGPNTTYAYDGLGRVVQVLAPDGASTTSFLYTNNAVRMTDAAGRARQTVTDGLGRLAQVVEDPDGLSYSTSYSYNPMDELVTVAQGGQTRSFHWDTLQRMTTATNPENDALNQVTGITYSDGVTPGVTFGYDTATLGAGLLATVTSAAATNLVTGYDARGNVTASSQATGGETFPFAYTYIQPGGCADVDDLSIGKSGGEQLRCGEPVKRGGGRIRCGEYDVSVRRQLCGFGTAGRVHVRQSGGAEQFV